ncbi:MAG TPA: NADH-quinone oxidoreductase subunit N [Phycisphaerae bacterium]
MSLLAATFQTYVPAAHELRLFAPELALVGTLIALLIAPLVSARDPRTSAGIVLLGALATLLLTVQVSAQVQERGQVGLAPASAAGMLIADNLSVFFKLILCVFLIAVTLLWRIGPAAGHVDATEFFVLLVGSAIGMVFMVSSLNLLMLVVAVEMASLPSYAIVGFDKRSRPAAEASLKYVVFGAICAAITLYGASLIYGLFGTINFADLTRVLPQSLTLTSPNRLTVGIALACLFAGIGFKISAVPFHFWAPDVFQGARIEVTTWLSVVSKGAGLLMLLRLVNAMSFGASGVPGDPLLPIAWGLGILAAVTCTFGNLAAYKQTSVKRLLAYSSIAHAGFMMMAAAVFVPPLSKGAYMAVGAVLFYLVIYLFMNLGAFGVTALVAWRTGSDDINAFTGLGRRAPWLAVPMLFCLVSLVGIPPFGGFMAKYWLLYALADRGSDYYSLYWVLIVIAVLNTLISLFYYFRVAQQMFLTDDQSAPISTPVSGLALVNACAVALLLTGFLVVAPIRRTTDSYARNLFRPRLPYESAVVAPPTDRGVAAR